MNVYLQIQAQEIEVGDLVWLLENDEIPCDMVLLGTAEPLGLCYIEVSSSLRQVLCVPFNPPNVTQFGK